MKNLKDYLMLLMVPFLLTGCVNYSATMDIKKNKSMDFTLTYLMQKSLVEGSDNDESKSELEKQGYTVEDITDEEKDMVGYKATKKFKNIDELSVSGEEETSASTIFEDGNVEKMFVLEKGLFKNKYTLEFKNDASESVSGEDSEYAEYAEYLKNSMEITFNVNLPYKPISDNATSKSEDGKNLTWNLLTTNDNIKVEFALYNLTLIYIICAIVLVIVVLVVCFILKGKKGNKEESSNNGVVTTTETTTESTIETTPEEIAESTTEVTAESTTESITETSVE